MKVIYSEKHRLHAPAHGFARGRKIHYWDGPERAEAILRAVRGAGHDIVAPHASDFDVLRTVHADDYLEYLDGAYSAWVGLDNSPDGVIPDVLPIRRFTRNPSEPGRQAGWYCFDTETPIVEGTFEAAAASASCALTGADLLLAGEGAAYALCRPPGHHAGRDYCGGYCYLNNAALAAERLRAGAGCKVAVLDVDYHHGNGTQDIFLGSGDVIYVSIHADPNVTFPYYWGYADETGEGKGAGCNFNIPLPRGTDEAAYLDALERALEAIGGFGASYLVVSLGTDTAAEDPLGKFTLSEDAFAAIGARVAALHLPTLAVQEGGYNSAGIGSNVTTFLGAF